MKPATQRVAEAVHYNAARALCFACLAAEQGLEERDVHAAALVVMVRAGVQMVRRRCSVCRRMDEVLVAQKLA